MKKIIVFILLLILSVPYIIYTLITAMFKRGYNFFYFPDKIMCTLLTDFEKDDFDK